MSASRPFGDLPHSRDGHAALRVERMQRIRAAFHNLLEDRHNIPIGMLYCKKAHLVIRLDPLLQIRAMNSAKIAGLKKGLVLKQ